MKNVLTIIIISIVALGAAAFVFIRTKRNAIQSTYRYYFAKLSGYTRIAETSVKTEPLSDDEEAQRSRGFDEDIAEGIRIISRAKKHNNTTLEQVAIESRLATAKDLDIDQRRVDLVLKKK